jgi:acyl transferase domain-containing protein
MTRSKRAAACCGSAAVLAAALAACAGGAPAAGAYVGASGQGKKVAFALSADGATLP